MVTFMEKKKNYIIESFNKAGISCNDKQAELFIEYYEMLIEKNKVMNLTAITEFNDVIEKHFIDSIYIIKSIDMSKVKNIIDIGTGAGFPGIPLKIMYPDINITLIDSLNKRVIFLNDVIDRLKLNNIQAFHGRAEEYGRNKDYREKYDLCVSRAVARLSSLSEYCIPFVSVNGYFVSYKSGDCKLEIDESSNAIKKLSSKIENIEFYNLPGTDISRCLVKIIKQSKLSNFYPRKAGVPTKNPLK